MKLGIKCEIHDCTIELAKWLEKKEFMKRKISSTLKNDKELRIENQYYLKNKPVRINSEELRDFVLGMKEFIDGVTPSKISEIRKTLKEE